MASRTHPIHPSTRKTRPPFQPHLRPSTSAITSHQDTLKLYTSICIIPPLPSPILHHNNTITPSPQENTIKGTPTKNKDSQTSTKNSLNALCETHTTSPPPRHGGERAKKRKTRQTSRHRTLRHHTSLSRVFVQQQTSTTSSSSNS